MILHARFVLVHSFIHLSSDLLKFQFHVKNVVFHEGLKGWECCKKRVTDFDECLAIEGCAIGRHKPAQKKLTKQVYLHSRLILFKLLINS